MRINDLSGCTPPVGVDITITDVPILLIGSVAGVAYLGERFGQETVAAGFNDAADMPSEEAYEVAAQVAVLLMRERSISLPLLVNLIASKIHAGES